MRKILHFIYYIIGILFNWVSLLWWRVRDALLPPKTDSILFVAHPDDDTLFFHTFITSQKPYIVLLSDGWSLRRMVGFVKVMKKYGVKYRAYPLKSRDKRTNLIKKYVLESYQSGHYKYVITHNSTGEYGHEMHKRVHDAVKEVLQIPILAPVSEKEISKYPISNDIVQEKEQIFKLFYKTELFVLGEYKEWVENEKLIIEE